MNPRSSESQMNWIQGRLKPRSTESRVVWIPDQLNPRSTESKTESTVSLILQNNWSQEHLNQWWVCWIKNWIDPIKTESLTMFQLKSLVIFLHVSKIYILFRCILFILLVFNHNPCFRRAKEIWKVKILKSPPSNTLHHELILLMILFWFHLANDIVLNSSC